MSSRVACAFRDLIMGDVVFGDVRDVIFDVINGVVNELFSDVRTIAIAS